MAEGTGLISPGRCCGLMLNLSDWRERGGKGGLLALRASAKGCWGREGPAAGGGMILAEVVPAPSRAWHCWSFLWVGKIRGIFPSAAWGS